jgi:predicted Zn finger-like uncharacterized protein
MPDERYTRCPGCATVFRVTPEQLAARAGQVRCGQCKTVFDGIAQRVSLASASVPGAGVPTPVEEALAAPTADGAAPAAATLREETFEPPAESVAKTSAADAGGDAGEVPYDDRFSSAGRGRFGRAHAVFYAVAIVLLLLLGMAQAVFHLHDAIAARWPAAQPALARLCDVAGCAIRPLRDMAMSDLSIESSDLQADPAHRGLLILTATLRSRASWSLAYPHLELTLTDAQDRVVVRRALAPADYAGGTADIQRGIAPNGEVALRVFIDASATSQAGYRLYMFYP